MMTHLQNDMHQNIPSFSYRNIIKIQQILNNQSILAYTMHKCTYTRTRTHTCINARTYTQIHGIYYTTLVHYNATYLITLQKFTSLTPEGRC